MKRQDSCLNKKILTALLMICLIVIQIAVLGFFSEKKVGYHMDEILSYTLSNTVKSSEEYNWAIDSRVGQWSDNSYFTDKLTVNENEKFDYDSVYYNQTTDVHPPFFYDALHTVCSITPGVFSKWSGIILNIIFAVGTTIILFLLGKKLLKNDYLALIGSALWALSCIAVNMVTYIRMYSIVTFWVVLFFYLLVSIFLETTKLKRNLCFIGVLAVLFLGALTHYYFIIFAFFSVGATVIILLIKKRIWDSAKLAVSSLAGLLLAVLYYPAMIDHMFNGYRGEEAIANLESKGLLSGMRAVVGVINESIFSKLGFILAGILLVLLCYALFRKSLKITSQKVYLFVMMAIPILGYVIIISRIAPYKNDRYFSPVMPIILTCFVFIMYEIIGAIIKNRKIVLSVLSLSATVIIIGGLLFMPKNYLYTNSKESFEFAKNNSNLPAIVYNNVQFKTYNIYNELSNYPSTFIYKKTAPEAHLVDAPELKNTSSIVLYVDNALNINSYIEHAKKSTGFNKESYCFNTEQYRVYLLER